MPALFWIHLLPFTVQRYRLTVLLVHIHRYHKMPSSVFSSEMPLHLATLPFKTDPRLQTHSILFCSVPSAPHQDYCRKKNFLNIIYLGKCTLLSTGQKSMLCNSKIDFLFLFYSLLGFLRLSRLIQGLLNWFPVALDQGLMSVIVYK